MNNYTGATYKAEAKSYGAYPAESNSQRNSDIDPTWTAYPGAYPVENLQRGQSNSNIDPSLSLLEEQKKINSELRDEMRQMQMQMRMMTNNMMNLNQGSSNNQMMGSMGNGMSNMMGAGNNWNTQASAFPPNMSAFNTNLGYTSMGQGYRDDSGGGKMGGYNPTGGLAASRSVPYNMRVPKQPGDWDCPVCNNMNFARRITCNGKAGTCGEEKKPEYVRQGVEYVREDGKQSDSKDPEKKRWICTKCKNNNYAHRTECNMCGVDKAEGCETGASSGGAGGGPKPRKDGDWFCPRCKNMNFSYRTKCNRTECGFQKKDLETPGPRSGPMDNNMNAMMNMAMQTMGNNMGMGMANNMGMGNMDMANFIGMASNFANMASVGGGMGPPMANNSMGMLGGGGDSRMMRGGSGGRRMDSGKPNLRRHTGPEPRDGDWECPRCYNLNFSSRSSCNGTKNGESCRLQKPDFEKYRVKEWKNASNIKDTDWDCWVCSNVNFSTRSSCNRCKTDKKDAQDENLRNKESSESRESRESRDN